MKGHLNTLSGFSLVKIKYECISDGLFIQFQFMVVLRH